MSITKKTEKTAKEFTIADANSLIIKERQERESLCVKEINEVLSKHNCIIQAGNSIVKSK